MAVNTIAVFGISGATGQAIAGAAAARGWVVRGLVRPHSEVPGALSGLAVVRGDFADTARIVDVVSGTDAVCCVFGPRAPYTDVFCSAATASILAAMRQAGVRRIVCQTGAMVGPANRTVAFEWMARAYARRQPAAAADRLEQERIVEDSEADWTIVKPPRLTNRPARHAIEAGPDVRVGMLSSIGRADLASFILDAIARSEHLRARVFVRG